MSTDMPSRENEGEIRQELSAIDLGIENLSFSARQCDSSFMDGSPASMIKSDISDVDHLLLDFDSINIAKSLDPRDNKTINRKADVVGSIDQADLPEQGHDQGEDTNKFDSIGLDRGAEPSAQRGPATEGFSRIDKTSRQPLIFYTSSWRKTRNIKLNKNNKSPKPSTHGKMTPQNTVVDLSSLPILRKSRSSLSKRPRSSSWGYIGSTIPDSEENGTHSLNLGNEKKSRKVRGCKGKRNSFRAQICKESFGKSCAPTGRISLKIRIGNKLCGMGNATENFSSFGTLENNEEKSSGIMTASHERSSEKVLSDVDASGKLLDAKAVLDNSSFNTSSDFHHIIRLEEGNPLTASIDNLCSDVGTSPDSEVINSVPDVPLCEKGLPDIQHCPVIPGACIPLSDISSPSLSTKKSNKGSKNGKLHQAGSCTLAIDPNGAGSLTNAKASLCVSDVSSLIMPQSESKKGKMKFKLHKLADCGAKSKQMSTDAINDAKESADYKAGQDLSAAMIAIPKPYLDNGEPNNCLELASAMGSSYAEVCETILCSNGQKSSKYSRVKGGNKAKIAGLSRKKDKSSKKKENKKNFGSKLQVSNNVCANGISRTESHHSAGNQASSNLGEIRSSSNDLTASENSQQFPFNEATEQSTPLDDAWVLCDECEKWRRIPAALADRINETKCGWTCKENTDKKFADCSIPQEKSDSDINDELGLPEDAGTVLKFIENHPKAAEQSSWSLIKSNLFLHRSRKKQTIDEVMVCHCKSPSDGRMGCGAKCLNRMLNIECVQGTCPCGELCSNQQFQKRKYSKLKWFKCGKKGYGLQALEDISRGQFLIEYVGEVLDVHAYEARQREYALNGHKHFYFMTLNGSEVIDACAKGNLGRFINHSCNPNCRTEKWMVNGEVCIGLFSLRDIKKGEEVTFDYNYVRVFGAAAKKCVCGSANCRGYIGGDPTNSEVIVQDDSDDDFSEPVMVCEDRELNEEWKDIMSCSVKKREKEIVNEPTENLYSSGKVISASTVGENIIDSHASESLIQKVEGSRSAHFAETVAQNKYEVDHSVTKLLAVRSETNKISDESLNGSMLPNSMVKDEDLHSQTLPSKLMDVSLQTDGSLNIEMCSAQGSLATATSPSKSLPDTVESKRKLKCSIMGRKDEVAKSGSVVKTRHSSSLVRKTKVKTNVVKDKGTPDVDKLNAALHKSKKLTELSIKSHFEAVEEKLNELLDSEGGISKRKDASKGYLKLLFLTAASGNNGHGEAIQSNRELSMILDALLKTRSRSVLVDIINKNGLQMLHNIMKRYRKEFIKTPILRKLLKVLEHLALREILTLDHITGGPPCPGVESFRDSILILTEHTDKQVHQIARNFRDRWIPRSLRKTCCMDRDGGRSDFHQRSSHDSLPMSNDKGEKPSEAANYCEKHSVVTLGTVETSPADLSTNGVNGAKTLKRKSRWDNPVSESTHSRTSPNLAGDKQLRIDEDVPPGFSSPCNSRVILSDTPAALTYPEIEMSETQHLSDVVFGDSQPRFVSCMRVSYGISKSLMQQFSVPKTEAFSGWAIVPGVPFHPFPPLPPHSRSSGDLPVSAARCASTSELSEKAEQHNDASVAYPVGQKCSGTCSMELPYTNTSVANAPLDFHQGPSNSLGRKFFRQQKWNHSKLAPPWVRMRNSWGYPVNNPPNNPPGVGVGNGPSGFRNLYSSQEVNWRGEL